MIDAVPRPKGVVRREMAMDDLRRVIIIVVGAPVYVRGRKPRDAEDAKHGQACCHPPQGVLGHRGAVYRRGAACVGDLSQGTVRADEQDQDVPGRVFVRAGAFVRFLATYNWGMSAGKSPVDAAPRSSMDDVIDCYKRNVDRTLLREALALTPGQRVQKLVDLLRATDALREAGARAFR